MRGRAHLLTFSGALLLAASAAHFLGWGQFGGRLDGVEPAIVAALRIGWVWGSVGFATFGVVVLAAAFAWGRGGRDPRPVAVPIALALVGFGAWAWVWRDFNPHFLTFVVLGALVGAPLFGRWAGPA